jgi:hypothetical protein
MNSSITGTQDKFFLPTLLSQLLQVQYNFLFVAAWLSIRENVEGLGGSVCVVTAVVCLNKTLIIVTEVS